ncbi:MAG: sulfur carrier protein ThiS [Mycobacteriales bacterium]
MTITLNGELRSLAPGTAVGAVIVSLGAGATGTAVAVNGEVVPRSDWRARQLADGDSVEVLTAVPGG